MMPLMFLCFLYVVNVDAGIPIPEPPGEPTMPMLMLGIRLPTAKKTLALRSFRRKVVGRTYTKIYSIVESSDPGTLRFRELNRFYLSNTGVLMLDYTFSSSPTSCIQSIGDEIGVVVQRGKHFWVDGERRDDTGDTFPTRTFFMSRSPKDHLILVTCDTANIEGVNKYCTGEFKVDILVSADPPNDVNWYKIEKTLRRGIRLKLTDSRNNFLYQGNECLFDEDEG